MRGSRNRSGVRALKGLIDLMRQGYNAAIVADGSQGPPRVMQAGALLLAGKIGQAIAHPSVTVVDDGRKPGGFASRPYDGEGVATRRTVVIEKGVLQSYLLNTYAARKLGLRTTGNASRGLAGAPGISATNLYLEPGATPAEVLDTFRAIERIRSRFGTRAAGRVVVSFTERAAAVEVDCGLNPLGSA